jgi:hypothetical protein
MRKLGACPSGFAALPSTLPRILFIPGCSATAMGHSQKQKINPPSANTSTQTTSALDPDFRRSPSFPPRLL